MRLSPRDLEKLALRRDKLAERLARLRSALDGGNLPVRPLISDAFGAYSMERMDGLVEELTQAWGIHELYRSDWDFAEAATERDGEYTYDWDVDAGPAADFLYCSLRLVGSCPWHFEGTVDEVRRLAAHVGEPTSVGDDAPEGVFILNDVYAQVGPDMSFFQNMDALRRLLEGELSADGSVAEHEPDETFAELIAQEYADASDEQREAWAEEDRWARIDMAENEAFFERVEEEGRLWKEGFSDADKLLARYQSFAEAWREGMDLRESFAQDVSFAFDMLFASHGISHLLDDETYFTTYHRLRGLQGQLTSREV